jgi:hypothetical protein
VAEPVPMTRLTSVWGAFRANVLAARLASEGIDTALRGAVDGPYGVTVGDLARVDVYVADDQLGDARYVLLADEVDATLAAPAEWWDAGTDHRPWWRGTAIRWVALVVVAVAVLTPLLARLADT